MKNKNKYTMVFSYAVFMEILLIISFIVQKHSVDNNFELRIILIFLAFFIGFIFIGLLFLQIFKINHEGLKRFCIISIISGALLFLILFADSLEIFEHGFYTHDYFTETIYLFNLGLLIMLIIINSIKWVVEGFNTKK